MAGIKGNFGPPGDWIDVKGIETYETLESMLASPNLDVIDICLPHSYARGNRGASA